ncbi:GAF domain-containing protein [Undibacterium piscinae]|jgi:signal transduction histidine kinase|uniref:histidine kinase n=1 Tax=Undibacterium piscinae TaxID=2495591 RepID=A0A6M4A8X2_9BURK|nr:GAF domain-containing protein [Undibacterium piscinae]
MENRLHRLEAVQAILLEIGQKASACSDITEFLKTVHSALGRIMYAANFYVALNDAEKKTLRFVYFIDEADATPDPDEAFALPPTNQSATSWVIQNRQRLVMTAQEFSSMITTEWNGSPAEHWMGCPLLDQHGHSLGAIVIQSYQAQHMYSEEDQALFALIANHVCVALQTLQGIDRLERAVRERTELLEHEVAERRHAEALQRALYEIAELSTSVAEVSVLYAQIHQSIAKLLVVRNFLIARFHPESNEISIQYFVDEKDSVPETKKFPMGVGLSSYVIKTRQAQLIDQARLQHLTGNGEIQQTLGNLEMSSWMGAPMLAHEQIYGAIVIQSYDPQVIYTEADLNLLAFVANHVATSIAKFDADYSLRIAKNDLEQQNSALNQTMQDLQQAQSELVRQEKMASLGGLVAGIAHEINTPLGICVTATSHLAEELKLIRQELTDKTLNEQSLLDFLDVLEQALRILESNTQRAATLVRSFKQVAVDQSSDELREFDLRNYLDEILQSLQPKFKGKRIEITLDCAAGITVKTYPGALSQIMTNMLMNSLLHGFENNQPGKIHISALLQQTQIILHYADDGAGMDSASLEKLFDPFYTTKRGQGGSGLGAHIIYNLITGALSGSIRVRSEPGHGLSYNLSFPQRLS